MGNAAVAEELSTDDLEELYELSASETGPEAEPGEEDEDDEEGIEPEGMPQD